MDKNIRKLFPTLTNYNYLNTAATGLLSKAVLDYRKVQNELFLNKGSLFRDEKAEVLAETREALADFFSAEANKIALTPNFSFGFNVLLEGLPKNAKILLLEGDYPSINLAVEARGFECCYADICAQMESEIYRTVEREKPDAFAFSLVQYISGIKIDLNFIKKLKTDFPDLILIGDGTQYCGTEEFDFSTSGLDVLGASCYKWLNAGFGSAFFMFQPEMEERIFPKTKGFGSNIGKYKQAENALIGKFEPGHLNTADFGSIPVALKLQRKIGQNEIQKQNKNLSARAFQAFNERELLSKMVGDRSGHSNLFNLKGDDHLFESLLQNKIICSQRGNGIRVSFHYYNKITDLEKLLLLIDS